MFFRSRRAHPPFPNSYWVRVNTLLAGEHPYIANEAAARERIETLTQAGIDFFVDLTEQGEMPAYQALLPSGTGYLRSGIVDGSVPAELEQMVVLQLRLRNELANGRRAYVHCRAGIGRTGTVIGCFLADGGLHGRAALVELNRLWKESERSKTWRKIPETPQQADYVRGWRRRVSGADHR